MSHSSKKHASFDVVVIGAGAAGIACIKELVNRGYNDVVCLEALDEPGGRVKFNSKFGDLGGMAFHLPAQFQGTENLQNEFWGAADLINFARKSGFRFYRENDKPKFKLYRNGQKLKESIVNRANSSIQIAINSAIRKINAKELQPDISLKEALADLLEDDICRSLINTVYSSTDTGLDADDISFMDYSNTMPSNPGLYPEDGMGTILKAYARPIKNFIQLNKEVLSVKNEKGISAIRFKDTVTGEEQEVTTKMLVITVSAGVLQAWLKEKRITLPKEKVQAINSIQMGHLNKNILIMDKHFFTDNNISSFTHINIRSNRLDKDANFLAIEMHDNFYLINFVGGKKSLEYERRGKTFARNASLQILASVFGQQAYSSCIDSYLSKWSKNSYFYGSYSATTKNNFNARLELSKPLDKNIFKAGEEVRYHANEFSYHTHISGALDSGFMAANQVIRELEQ
jgi:monoamine oxidase